MDFRGITDLVKSHPILTLAATHAVTSAAFVWVLSDGQPVKWVVKKLFQAVVAAAPASVVEAEQAKLRKGIEKSVIGHSLDGQQLWLDLPEKGERGALVAAHFFPQNVRAAHARKSSLTRRRRPPSPPLPRARSHDEGGDCRHPRRLQQEGRAEVERRAGEPRQGGTRNALPPPLTLPPPPTPRLSPVLRSPAPSTTAGAT
jgi:hypothetical protein